LNPEIGLLRREENFKDLANSIADAAIYVFLSEPRITDPIKAEAIRVAQERYGGKLPAPMIRSIVEATITAELMHRREQASAREDEARRRDGGARSSVLRSPRSEALRRYWAKRKQEGAVHVSARK
jgi:hypothetical protein